MPVRVVGVDSSTGVSEPRVRRLRRRQTGGTSGQATRLRQVARRSIRKITLRLESVNGRPEGTNSGSSPNRTNAETSLGGAHTGSAVTIQLALHDRANPIT